MNNFAVLGWGSLIWDKREEFIHYLKDWINDGPRLPIEFSRISNSRQNALTLVIDRELGTMVEVLYAFSKRIDTKDVVHDLSRRERTNINNIGYVNLENGDEHGRDQQMLESIKRWARSKNIPFVAWTDLKSSFSENDFDKFSKSAMKHLRSLNITGMKEAVKYIVNTPHQIDTRLRRILMSDEWFTSQVQLYYREET